MNSNRRTSGLTGRVFPAVMLLLLLTGVFNIAEAGRGLVNLTTLQSVANTNAALVLNSVPLNITEASDTLVVTWTDNVSGVLYYAAGSPGADYAAYTALSSPDVSQAGMIRVIGSKLPAGQLTCYIQSSQTSTDKSTFFQVLRASGTAPVPSSPITSAGGMGITTTTPTLSWAGVTGVPYYLVFVADQPFEIISDDAGTRVEGANVVWQAITSNTSIQYGIPDPSGTIDNEMVPPLVGSLDRTDRPRYNWTVLNCYGNSVEYTSSVVGQVSGFEVERAAPFDSPQLIVPEEDSELYDEEILFQWSPVSGASSYFVYLSLYQLYSNGTEIMFPVWRSQTTDNAVVLPASSLLQNGKYNWKVIASDGLGSGSISDGSSFNYNVDSGTLYVITEDTDGNRVDLVTVEFEAIDGPSIQQIATNDAGSYTVIIPVGTYALHASKQGYEDASSNQFSIATGASRTVSLQLAPLASTVVGKVTSNTGAAIDGATVKATQATGAEETTTSNISGEFTLGLDPGTWTLSASAAGYQTSTSRTISLISGQNMDLASGAGPILLTPYTFILSGTVTNTSGQPIPLAQVMITKGEETVSQYTGQSGQYSFTVGNGTWILKATKAGYYLPSGNVSVVVNGANVTKNVTLNAQAAIVSGFISVSGSLVNRGGETVRAVPSAGDPVETVTADNGSFSVGLPPGTWTLSTVMAGYTSDPVVMTLGPGQTANGVTLNATPNPSSISGTVKTSSGSPLASATVTAGGVSVLTNSSGVFTLSVSAGSYTLTASKSGYSTVTSGPWGVTYGEALSGIAISLSANVATVSGSVTYGGSGVIGATVTATPTTSGSAIQVTTGSGGTYSVGIVPGSYTLTVAKNGFTAVAPTSYSLALQPGAVITSKNFSLQPNTGTITGQVTSSAGGIYGATVTVRESGTTSGGVTTTTSATGSYTVSMESGKAYTVSATKTGYNSASSTTTTLTSGAQLQVPLALTLLGASVSGTVSSSEGTPLQNATVIASSSLGDNSTTTNSSGGYTLSLQPGSWVLDVSALSHLSATDSVVLSGGQNLSGENWSLTSNYATLSGSVVNGSGSALASATVELVKSGSGSRQTTTDASGYYRFSNVTGGTYSVIARKTGYVSDTLAVGLVVDGQIKTGAQLTLTLLTSNFTGTVTAGGSGVASATVSATSSTGTSYTTVSSSTGAYTVSGIPAGTYTITPQKSGYTGTAATSQSVTANATATVNLTMIANTGSVSGTVSNSSGSGLTGVKVSATSPSGNSTEVYTSPGGTYTVSNLNTAENYDLVFTLSGYQTSTVSAAISGNTYNVTLPVNALRLSGTTRNQAGTAIANVPITATNLSDGSQITATSDASGAWTMNGAAANASYRVLTSLNSATIEEEDTTLSTTTSNVSAIPLVMIQRTASISGNATLTGVTITATRTGGGTKVGYTDSNGYYTLSNLNSGNWTVAVSKQGATFSPSTQTVSTLTVGESRTGVSFTGTAATVSISGTVTDDSGQEMIEAVVTLISPSSTRQTIADSSGDFSFTGLPGYTSYTLTVNTGTDTRLSSTRSVSATNTNITGADLTVTVKEGRITGTLEDDSGAALSSVAVSVDGGSYNFYSNTYALTGLSRGTHGIVFSKTGHQEYSTEITLSTGESIDTTNIVLAAVQNQITLRVRYFYEDEYILMKDARVVLTASDASTDTLYTNSIGLVTFVDLDPDSLYTLAIDAPGLIPVTIGSVQPSGTDFTRYIYPEANAVFGVFADNSGQPLVGRTVRLRSQTGEVLTTITNSKGQYSLTAPGEALVLIGESLDGSKTSYIHNFAVPTGSSVKRDLTLRNASEIFGVVETSTGSIPASRAYLETANSTTGTFAFLHAESDGTYRIRGLRPGILTVTATAEGYSEPDPVSIDLAAGETQEVNWTVTALSTSMVGRVVDANGEGVPDVEVSTVGSGFLETTTSGSGDFSFVDINSGLYSVTISKHGYLDSTRSISVASGDVTSADFTILAISDQVSGQLVIYDGVTPADSERVNLRNSSGSIIASDTTDNDGYYAFALSGEGDYTVDPVADTSPAEYDFTHSTGDGHADLDFTLVPGQGTGTVSGTITFRSTPVEDAEITLEPLDAYTSYTGTSDASGAFTISAAAPVTYRAVALHDSFGSVTSSSFLLEADSTETLSLAYASGQIGVTVVSEEGEAVAGNLVAVSAQDGSFSSSLLTDENGYTATEANLEDGDYLVEVSPTSGLLPTAPVTITIAGGDSVGTTIPLGISITTPTVGNVGDSIAVQLSVPDSYTITSALLYYVAVGESITRTAPMTILSPTSVSSTEILDAGSLKRPRRGAKAPHASIASSSTSLSTLGTESVQTNVTYQGKIPPQTGSGSLIYYPELVTSTGLVFGGEGAAITLTISSVGRLARVSVTPDLDEIQPGVPTIFQVEAFDELDSSLTASVLDSGSIVWSTSVFQIDTSGLRADSAIYLSTGEGLDTITVSVEQRVNGSVLTSSSTTVIQNLIRVLGELQISAEAIELAAGDSMALAVVATDTGGALMQVAPEWEIDSLYAENFRAYEYSQEGMFVADSGRFGTVEIVANDPLTGIETVFNDQNGAASEGLSLYVPVTSAASDTFVISDGGGTVLTGWFNSEAVAGSQGRFMLRRPALVELQKSQHGMETASDMGYRIILQGNLNEARMEYQLTLPIPEGTEARNPMIGRWNVNLLGWEDLGGEVSVAGDEITASIVPSSTVGIDGLYTVVIDAQPLDIENLVFTPNPFSPMGEYPLSIEFTLHSLYPRPYLTVEIFNMVGQHVCTLLDRVPMDKGEYAREGGVGSLIWDGTTGQGRMARNGRYLIRIVAEDPEGSREELKPVVLIK